MIDNFKNNIFFDLTEDVRLICKPLYKLFDIKVFNYIRIEKTGGVSYLCSNHNWITHYLNNKYPLVGAFEQNKNLLKFKYVLWSGLLKHDQILIDNRDIHKIYHGITFIRNNNNLCEFYNIGSGNKNPAILNELINNLDVFENFINDFHLKGKTLIQKAVNNSIYFQNQNLSGSMIQINREIIKNKHDLNNIHLTNREIDCLELAIEGKTAFVISKILNCSVRTIESRLENIKTKLDCNKMISLGYKVAKLGLDKKWIR